MMELPGSASTTMSSSFEDGQRGMGARIVAEPRRHLRRPRAKLCRRVPQAAAREEREGRVAAVRAGVLPGVTHEERREDDALNR